jgi:hypothetical protein
VNRRREMGSGKELRSGKERQGKGKGENRSQKGGELTLVKKKREYNFEIGRLKVQNLTRFRLKSWDDDCLSQESEKIEAVANHQATSEVGQDKTIKTVEEPPVSLALTQCLNADTRISLADDSAEFPYALHELQTTDPMNIVEEEKQIYSHLDLIEKKRIEALKKLNKKREDRIESNRLMALYRISMKQSETVEHDSKSVYHTRANQKNQ